MKTMLNYLLIGCLLTAFVAMSAPAYARKVVWISLDPEHPNDKTFDEGYYKQIKQPGDTLQVGGDPNLIWCTMQAGDTFIVLAHGEQTDIDDGAGNVTSVEGGGIVINGNGHAGFGPQGPTEGGTGLPGETPFELQPKTNMNVTVIVVACWSAKSNPGASVRAVTETFDGTLVGAGSTIIGAQNEIQFGDVSLRAIGVRADISRLIERLKELSGAGDLNGVYGWLDNQPFNRHQFVLDSIKNADHLALEVAVWVYSPPRGLDGELAAWTPDIPRHVFGLDDDPGDFIDTTFADYVSTAPCVSTPPAVAIGVSRCLQFTPYGSIEVRWSSDLPGPPVFSVAAGCSEPCSTDPCAPVSVVLATTGLVANEPGVWSAVFTNPGAETGCACIMLDAMLPAELATFTALSFPLAIRLDWSTYSETLCESFQIYRRDAGDAEFIPLSARIPNRGSPTQGGRYSYDDRAVEFGRSYDYLLVEYSINGAETRFEDRIVTAALPNQNLLPSAVTLEQNTPNPFNAAAWIRFELPASAHTRLTVYDLHGKEVKRLIDQTLNGGEHRVSFDAHDLPTGIYIYRLTAAGASLQKKMVLLR